MKKFLFVVAFTSLSNQLFSEGIFVKEFYRDVVNTSMNAYFKDNDTERTTTLRCLKHLAQNYKDLLLTTKTYDNALTILKSKVNDEDITDLQFDKSHIISLLNFFSNNIKDWFHQSETAIHNKITKDVENDNTLKKYSVTLNGVYKLFFGNQGTAECEKDETMAFAEALIQYCNEQEVA